MIFQDLRKKVWQQWSEEWFPKLTESQSEIQKKVINYANDFLGGQWMGMGMEIEKLDDEEVGLRLPYRLRNKDIQGGVHTAALYTLAEYTNRLYWHRHIDSKNTKFRVKQVEAEFFERAFSEVYSRLRLDASEREARLFRLRKEKKIDTEIYIDLYDSYQKRVAQFEFEIEFIHASQEALPESNT